MTIAFKTERTLVKPWKAAFEGRATDALVELLTPEVLESLPPPLQISNTPENCAAWIEARLSESDVLAIVTPDTGDLIGLILLVEFAVAGAKADIHLGYLLAEKHWGKGLASEVILGLVARLAQSASEIRLLGGVEKANPSSARVLLKAGFEREAALSDDETDMYVKIA
ncbi:MAG: GNAT family N-acetyltransferase [Rhodobacteraceae bacterium]|nr:GNAT family N-acetyltransferase [Paracoccaceae bacterium]